MVPQELDPDWILFQGSGVLAVNKPAGVPVHRGTSHAVGLAEMIDAWVRMNPGVLEVKPGNPVHPVHRLDREASGVLLFGLTLPAARELHEAFSNHTVRKVYLAVVAGPLDALGTLKGKVRSRLRGVYRWLPAELTYRRLAGDERLSLAEVVPAGGRTHQIRALFAAAGRPLAGDVRYGKPNKARQFLERLETPFFLLHARELTLPARILGSAKRLEAPLPAHFVRVLEKNGWPLPAFEAAV